MPIKTPTPKFKEGDRVIRNSAFQTQLKKTGVITEKPFNKPNARGAASFHYKVKWDGSSGVDICVQQREAKVVSVDHHKDHVTRYRRCLACGEAFKTEEHVVKYNHELGIPKHAKLRPDQVREIRNNPDKLTWMALAEKHGIEPSYIHAIRSRKVWKHLE